MYIEFPISKVIIVPENPDTIIFQTELPSLAEEVPCPFMVMTVPSGKGEEYVRETLQIPSEIIQVLGRDRVPSHLHSDRSENS